MRLLVSITAASGGGKSTLEEGLVDYYSGGRVRTITTRTPRPNETSEDYDFHKHWKFWIKRFLSWMWTKNLLWVVSKHGNLHATDVRAIYAAFEQTGWLAYIIITPERHELLAHWCKKQGIQHIAVHLNKPTDSELRRRLSLRLRSNSADTERRIKDSNQFEKEAINAAKSTKLHFIEPSSASIVLETVIELINNHAPN